ncbi:ABC transporter transmembrane domain-containing protein [Rhodoferax antarcticus]|uniref:ABC transporter transmembrane region family protein n=1 Tax=Rhodoferax antarcticus ANT.BR TaxID=1111071 RepID=A0A1Q8YDK3_9BURK|nr:ABC transporter transmembrane domain-containing protein [Rhodoferax antarcticus]APW45996.1 ABC transporter [Rhodoferax antarcticus]MCW2310451.1 ATP-binding cassette subfamily B protein [Rhodoferax antarcticus]OLP06128.1 ABC transporter transmembrane region family protein [Rhodoferax antarcticus ANT.BR]
MSEDSKPAHHPKSLSGLMPFLRPHKLRIGLALTFLIMAAVTTLAFPLALRSLIDGGLTPGSPGDGMMAVRGHFALLFAVAVALGVFSAARFYMVSWLGERVSADLRNAVYAHVLQQSPQFFETTQTGEVLSRLSADTTLVQTVVGSSLSQGLRNLVMGSGALVILVWTNPVVMAQVLLILILIVVPTAAFGRRLRKLSRASQDRAADSSAIAAEVLNAIPVVQSYTAELRETSRFTQATETAFEVSVRRSGTRSALVAFIIIATSAALLWGLYQGTQAVLAGTISAGHLGQTVIYVIILASAFAVLGEVYGDVLRAAGATERLMELLASQSPIKSPLNPAQTLIDKAGSAIEFDSITFHYPSRPNQAALHEFSLIIPAGQTVALVGPSGAGKSTVFQLLLRFYDPQNGRLLLDGVPTRDMTLSDLRQHIGIVPQDAVVFSSSALENIRYGRPEATDAEVKAAAMSAFADGFITDLPQGYDTFLGERGVRLSGGQRQRIAIARAILKNPPLLLLDEATSALDAESERMVQAALESAMRDRTTLVIAHRLATVQKANRIVVIDHGRLVEQGTHAELVGLGGVYAGLAALQFNA